MPLHIFPGSIFHKKSPPTLSLDMLGMCFGGRRWVVMLYQLRALVNLAQDIFNPIYNAITGSHFMWDIANDGRSLSLIKNLAKFESLRRIVSIAEISNANNIQTKELVKILN